MCLKYAEEKRFSETDVKERAFYFYITKPLT
jgi:hypothetical protein